MLVSSSQWIFPVSALHETPSIRISHIPLERELYDRSRGVEFLFRLGSTLLMFVRSCVKFARCPDVFQAVVGYGHGCNLVPPVLHALLYGRLFKTGTLAHNMLNVISYHLLWQDVAAACIFLATKTEECGRKLRDVARVFSAKVGNKEMSEIAMESKVSLLYLSEGPHINSSPHRNWNRFRLLYLPQKKLSWKRYVSNFGSKVPMYR